MSINTSYRPILAPSSSSAQSADAASTREASGQQHVQAYDALRAMPQPPCDCRDLETLEVLLYEDGGIRSAITPNHAALAAIYCLRNGKPEILG